VRAKDVRTLTLAIAALGVVALVSGGFSFPRAGSESHPTSLATTSRFDPLSFSFDTAANGWALGIAHCANTMGCLDLRETLNHGRSWSTRPLPSQLIARSTENTSGSAAERDGLLSIYFANANDGWIYGLERERPVLFSTHDGGAQWRQLSTALEGSYGFVFDVASLRGTAYLVAQSKSYHGVLESSPVGQDDWRVVRTPALQLPAGGATDTGAIVFKGDSGWLVVGNDRGVSGSAELAPSGNWVKWNPSCAAVGDSYVVPVPTTQQDLIVACQMGGFASPLSKSAPPGAKLQSVWLYTSHNGGRTFDYGPQLGRWLQNILVAPTVTDLFANRITNSTTAYEQFVRSVDGGHHWIVVRREWALSVSFQSTTQGVALLQGPPDVNTMIITSDGGGHWSPLVP
jgi:hypothetical protein